MNSKKMFLSLIPWVLFSVIINRRGADAAAIAALAAAALSLVFLVKDDQKIKVIDVTGIVTFGALAALGFTGGHTVTNWIADYGRGSAAIVLAVIMLISAMTVPFTEQYARESIPRAYWSSPIVPVGQPQDQRPLGRRRRHHGRRTPTRRRHRPSDQPSRRRPPRRPHLQLGPTDRADPLRCQANTAPQRHRRPRHPNDRNRADVHRPAVAPKSRTGGV